MFFFFILFSSLILFSRNGFYHEMTVNRVCHLPQEIKKGVNAIVLLLIQDTNQFLRFLGSHVSYYFYRNIQKST